MPAGDRSCPLARFDKAARAPEAAACALLGAACALLAGACAQSRVIQPLPPGQSSLGASLGGPMVQVGGNPLPVPILEAGGAHGLRERLAATGNIDLTALLYGTLHIEPGVVWHPIVHDRGPLPSLALSGSLHVLSDFDDLLVAPHLAAIASWPVARRHLVYGGIDTAVALQTYSRVVIGPLIGGEYRHGRLGFGLELKWLAPYYDVEPTAPRWISPGEQGFLSVIIGFQYHPEAAR
jgi:hypothetical protein